jgi:hypothetical protein
MLGPAELTRSDMSGVGFSLLTDACQFGILFSNASRSVETARVH